MAAEPTHNAAARSIELLACRLHDLAFDIGEVGITPHVQAKADIIADAVLAAAHGDAAARGGDRQVRRGPNARTPRRVLPGVGANTGGKSPGWG